MMKRIIAGILSLTALFCLAACGESADEEETTAGTEAAATAAEKAAVAAEPEEVTVEELGITSTDLSNDYIKKLNLASHNFEDLDDVKEKVATAGSAAFGMLDDYDLVYTTSANDSFGTAIWYCDGWNEAGVAGAVIEGDESGSEAWESLRNLCISLGGATDTYLGLTMPDENYHVVVILANSLNPSLAILASYDEEIIYDVTVDSNVKIKDSTSTDSASSPASSGAEASAAAGENEAAVVSEEPAASLEENETTVSTESVPAEYSAALKKGQSYLSHSAFSYTGLIDQLEYEGYSTEAATYGADNCGADWNEQALKKAKSYLSHSAFSYSGLIDQLEFEGFTTEEATYGTDNCGADWNEQAAKKAESYISHSTFTRDKLIGQLEFEGFTTEQATYGANAVGY